MRSRPDVRTRHLRTGSRRRDRALRSRASTPPCRNATFLEPQRRSRAGGEWEVIANPPACWRAKIMHRRARRGDADDAGAGSAPRGDRARPRGDAVNRHPLPSNRVHCSSSKMMTPSKSGPTFTRRPPTRFSPRLRGAQRKSEQVWTPSKLTGIRGPGGCPEKALHAERRLVAPRILDQFVRFADPDRTTAALKPVAEQNTGDLPRPAPLAAQNQLRESGFIRR